MTNTQLAKIRHKITSKTSKILRVILHFVLRNKMEIAIIVLLYLAIEIKEHLKKSNKTLLEFMKDIHFG